MGPSAHLVVRLDGADALEHPELGTVGPMVAARTGSHTTNGFAYLAGPELQPRALGQHSVRDLSATIRRLLGTTTGPPLDGRPIFLSSSHDPAEPH